MIRRFSWLWAAAIATAVPIYYLLSLAALGSFLERSARADQQQLERGIRWDFDVGGDLAGPATPAIARGRLGSSALSAPAAEITDFVSLNLRGQKIDARVFTQASIGIDMEKASAALLFFRETLGGPDYESPPLPLRAGRQELRIPLDQIDWRLHPGEPQSVSQRWGGASATVASLRLHPAAGARSGFSLDWLAIEPARPIGPRESVRVGFGTALATLRQPESPLLLVLSEPLTRPARVLELRRRIEQVSPASSLVLSPPEERPPEFRGPTSLTLLAVTLALTLLAIAWRRRKRLHAALSLTSIATPAAGLLLRPVDPGDAATLALAGYFTVLVTVYAVAGLREARGALSGSAGAWRAVALLATLGLLPALALAGSVSLPAPGEFAFRWLLYLPWAAFQQLFLCAVMYRLCRRLGLPETGAAVAAAALFGLAHFPNFELMAGTLGLAAIGLGVYRHHRGILPLSLLHATLGTCYLTLLPAGVLYSGAVGMRYFGS